MPRRPVVDDDEEIAEEVAASQPYRPDDLDHVERINAEVQDKGAIFAVLKQRKPDGGYSHLERMAVADFDIEKVKRVYGGGKYMVTYTGPKGAYMSSNTFEIDERFKPVPEAAPAPVATASGSGVAVPAAPVTESAQVARLEGLVAGLMAGLRAQPPAPVQPAGNPMVEAMAMAKEITGYAATLGGNRADSGGVSGTVAAVREILGLSRELSGEAPPKDSDPWDRLIAKGVEPLVDLAKQKMAEPKPVPMPVAPVVLPPVMPDQPPPPPLALVKDTPQPSRLPPGAPGWLTSLAAMVPELVKRAARNADPSTYAFYYLEERVTGTGDEVGLQEALKSPTFVEDVLTQGVRFLPEIGPHRAWFAEFLTALREAYEPEPEEPDDIPTPAPDGPPAP